MSASRRTRNGLLLMIALLVIALIALGCRRDDAVIELGEHDSVALRGDSPSAVTAASAGAADPTAQPAPAGFDACGVQGHVSAALDSIARWPRELMAGSDTCVLSVLDSLASAFAATGDTTYAVTLDALANQSDGYVSEYFVEIAERLWASSAKELMIYVNDHDRTTKLDDYLVRSWRMQYEGHSDLERARREARERVVAGAPTGLPDHAHANMASLMQQAGFVP